MLAAMTFVASLILLGTPLTVIGRKVAVTGALFGIFDASIAIWIAWREGETAANTFSHLMIGLMVAVVAIAGLMIAAQVELTSGSPGLGKCRQVLVLAIALALGLVLGTWHWIALLSEVPQLAEIMEIRGGGHIGAVFLSLRSFLMDDAMYRVFLLSALFAVTSRAFQRSRVWAMGLALFVALMVMRWDPAYRTAAAAASAAVYGLIYLRWGFGSLLISRLAAVLLAWPIARCLLF